MFKIFSSTERSAANHACHDSQPFIPELTSDQLPPLPLPAHEPGSPLVSSGRSERPLFSTVYTPTTPTEPRKTHQRSFTDHHPSPHDLPPLVDPKATERSVLPIPAASDLQHLDSHHSSPCQSRQSSPARRKARTLSLFTGGKVEVDQADTKPGKLAKWFEGESEPIKIGLVPSPKKEKGNPFEGTTAVNTRPQNSLHQKSASFGASKPAMASRFSFFSSKAAIANPTTPTPDNNCDELLNLNISNTFKSFDCTEPLSPASLQILQQQAESLFARLQVAYKERTQALREATAEKDTLAEETQGAEARAKHLKMQLDDMSSKLEEQDEAMMTLVNDLAHEKQARREEEETRKRTLKLVEQDTPSFSATARRSLASDVSFESEDDSSAESVFSRHTGTESPTMSMSSVSTASSPDGPHYAEVQRITSMPPAARLRLPPLQVAVKQAPSTKQSCANCEGVRSTDAWGVVGILREENRGLKQRVGELEGALDGCLDVVGRLGG